MNVDLPFMAMLSSCHCMIRQHVQSSAGLFLEQEKPHNQSGSRGSREQNTLPMRQAEPVFCQDENMPSSTKEVPSITRT